MTTSIAERAIIERCLGILQQDHDALTAYIDQNPDGPETGRYCCARRYLGGCAGKIRALLLAPEDQKHSVAAGVSLHGEANGPSP
jgi:hypothetical protein